MTATTQNLERIYEDAKSKFGFVPNLIREMAESTPVPAQLYLKAQEFLGEGALSPQEQQAVQLAVSARNECHYCTAAHTAGGKMAGLDPEDLRAIKEEGLPRDLNLASVVETARMILEKKGGLTSGDLKSLEGKDIDRAKIYEIIVLIGMKTITNYINHIAQTEIDAPLKKG